MKLLILFLVIPLVHSIPCYKCNNSECTGFYTDITTNTYFIMNCNNNDICKNIKSFKLTHYDRYINKTECLYNCKCLNEYLSFGFNNLTRKFNDLLINNDTSLYSNNKSEILYDEIYNLLYDNDTELFYNDEPSEINNISELFYNDESLKSESVYNDIFEKKINISNIINNNNYNNDYYYILFILLIFIILFYICYLRRNNRHTYVIKD